MIFPDAEEIIEVDFNRSQKNIYRRGKSYADRLVVGKYQLYQKAIDGEVLGRVSLQNNSLIPITNSLWSEVLCIMEK